MNSCEAYLEDEPLWYKDAIIYEVHVKAFYDSTNDGIGDFQGLIKKLDYLQSLGVTAIWLLPFFPSPLKDDGYDIADYFGVHPYYGTLNDFREFLREAHKRGLRVIIELVLNHTSDQNLWFQRARKAKPGSKWRNFYVWSDTPEKYKEARIIFKDFETSNWAWDPIAKAYYWHRFYSHQPDLNYDNPTVHEAIFRVIDYWLEMGVDGLRLDAVPYLYEREGTNCENLPETYEFLEKLRSHVDSKFKNRMLLAEANQWPEDAVAYFGKGNRCHMAFHFPLMPRIFMAVQMEDRFPIIDIMEQTPAIPESCQWALFLRNHDELTLEMVTDEERDYMYRIYAKDPKARINLGIRRRLAPLLENDRRKIELMNILLLSFPGTPVIYYGDEIGMGDNYYLGDRNGVRTPMQWSPDRNAGFSKANPQKLYLPVIIDPEYHYEAVNVENQEKNFNSLLWWMKRLIATRKRFKAFGRGSIEFLYPENSKILAFTRKYQDETVLVVVNLSRFSQVVELNLSKYVGFVPEEVFSKNKFPAIKDSRYVITLGPYAYYWFLLQEEEKLKRVVGEKVLPHLVVKTSWENVLDNRMRERLEEEVLPNYLRGCRWFIGKSLTIQEISVISDIPIPDKSVLAHLLLFEVKYSEGLSEKYQLPVTFASKEKAKKLVEESPQCVIAHIHVDEQEGILYDAYYDEDFRQYLLSMFSQKRKIKGNWGELLALRSPKFWKLLSDRGTSLNSQIIKGEHDNTGITYENVFFLKLYRKLDEGENPDHEIIKYLSSQGSFSQIPPFAGVIQYLPQDGAPFIIGVLEGYVPNQGNAWNYSFDAVGQYFERALSKKMETPKTPQNLFPVLRFSEVPPLFQELIGGVYLEMVSLLGKRTGELHLALSQEKENPEFTPEPFSTLYQRAVYQSMRSLVRRVTLSLSRNLEKLPEKVQEEALGIIASENEVLNHMQKILKKKISTMKIRIHGNYHLEHILYTGKDFVIIDFEGESARALSERRLKRSPLRDVAAILRSFEYVAFRALQQHASLRAEDTILLESWIKPWCYYVSGVFLHSYLNTVGKAFIVPTDKEEFQVLLKAFLLEKAFYELSYELENRPDWAIIPIKGIKNILQSIPETS
ncbi:MAG: maltose alpha-D-glucosyltransferase [Candidatus Jordarchaeaceae archaeon]